MLEIKDLHVSYGLVRALQGVSLNVPDGKLVCVIGSNGAGKTTLLRSISGLLKPSQGSIQLAGKEELVGRKPHMVTRSGVAHCPEGRRVFPEQTVTDNLILGAFSTMKKTGQAEMRKDIQNVFTIFPRLQERREQQAGTLSGGEQQMLAIGRALMSRPRVLLLDEPSMGLAPVIIDEVFKRLSELKERGITMLLVEQLAFRALGVADYGYVIENGKILIEGEASKLMNDPRVKEAYLGGG